LRQAADLARLPAPGGQSVVVEFVAPVTPEAVEGRRWCAWATPATGELFLFWNLFFVKS
jgi:hypothetical protein